MYKCLNVIFFKQSLYDSRLYYIYNICVCVCLFFLIFLEENVLISCKRYINLTSWASRRCWLMVHGCGYGLRCTVALLGYLIWLVLGCYMDLYFFRSCQREIMRTWSHGAWPISWINWVLYGTWQVEVLFMECECAGYMGDSLFYVAWISILLVWPSCFSVGNYEYLLIVKNISSWLPVNKSITIACYSANYFLPFLQG